MARYIIPLIIVVALLVYFFYPGDVNTVEIEGTIKDLIASARNKDSEGFIDHFSVHYKDEHGATYSEVKQMIEEAFDKYERFEADYSDLSVIRSKNEEGHNEASAKVDITITGVQSGKSHNLIGDPDAPDNIIITLKKTPLKGWKITKVEGIDKRKAVGEKN